MARNQAPVPRPKDTGLFGLVEEPTDEVGENMAEDAQQRSERPGLTPEEQAALNHPDVEAIKQFLADTGEIPTQASLDDEARAAEFKNGWEQGAAAQRATDAETLHASEDEVHRLRDTLRATQEDNRRLSEALAAYEAGQKASAGSEAAGDPTEGRDDPSGAALIDWWLALAADEVGPLIAKATEYGGGGRAQDLIDIGNQILHVAGKPTLAGPEGEAEAAELGIFFYVVGKMGRWQAAVAERRPVSDDTLHDIGIYVRMAQRIRAVGGWPV